MGRHLPGDANATYIVTQHMAPQHKSMMTELVGRGTPLRVLDIVDGLEPLPNHIHITLSNQDLAVEGNKLRLHAPSKEPGAPKSSVNRFFRSLATKLGERRLVSYCSAPDRTAPMAFRRSGRPAASPSPRTRAPPNMTACRTPPSRVPGSASSISNAPFRSRANHCSRPMRGWKPAMRNRSPRTRS